MQHMLENYHQKKSAGEGGFTLIELLIVIVILAILAAIVVFSVTGLNNTSAQSACKADVATVNTAAEAYYAQNSTGATTIGQLATAGFLHNSAPWAGSGASVHVASGDITVSFSGGSTSSAGDASGTVGTATC